MRRHGVDAAIFFSDIMVPLVLAGVDVTIVPGRGPGPRCSRSVRPRMSAPSARWSRMRLQPIIDGVGLAVAELGNTPLIGFAGAPFTLAAYLVEGGPSRDHLRARALMHGEPGRVGLPLGWAADVTGAFLRAQVQAGASAAQLFDSWVGSLSVADYERSVALHSARAIAPTRELGVPRSSTSAWGRGELLGPMHAIGADVIGVD